MPESQSAYRYHAFLSHNRAQKDWTRRLAQSLRQAGLKVFFDEDSIKLGEDLLVAIERGLRSSRHVLLVLSPEALKSNWVALEYSASLYKDPAAAERSLIPILRQDCDLPLTLARLNYLDARGEDFERQVEHLINGIDRVEVLGGESTLPQSSSMNEPKLTGQRREQEGAPFFGGILTLASPVKPSRSSIYIERSADVDAKRAIDQGNLMVLSGPRKIGKTSLLLRAHLYATSIGKRVAAIDLQMFGSGISSPQLYYSLCQTIATKLKCKKPGSKEFLRNPSHALAHFLEHLPRGVALFFDEFDVLRGAGVMEDFSMVLRAVHSRRATGKGTPVPILIGSWLQPEEFIDNRLVSPFNVGLHVRLRNFERGAAEALIRAALPTVSSRDADTLYEFVGGQPFLLQCGLYYLLKGKWRGDGGRIRDLLRSAITVDGPFSMYLTLLEHSLSDEDRKRLVEQPLHTFEPSDLRRFEGIGLLRRTDAGYEWAGRLHQLAFGPKKSRRAG